MDFQTLSKLTFRLIHLQKFNTVRSLMEETRGYILFHCKYIFFPESGTAVNRLGRLAFVAACTLNDCDVAQVIP